MGAGEEEERALGFVEDDWALAADWSVALSEAMVEVHTVATQEAATAMDSVEPMVVDWAVVAPGAGLMAEAMGTSGPD